MIIQRSLHVTTAGGLPSLPRLARLEWERASGPAYRHTTGRRAEAQAAVQITLSGCGALLTKHGAVAQRLPRGTALIFVAKEHDIGYGYPPGETAPYDFLYANIEGESALHIVTDLVAEFGHVVRIDPDHAGIKALASLLPRGSERHRRMAAAYSASLTFDLLTALVQANVPIRGIDDRLLDDVMTWMSARLDQPVSVAQAAAHVGVTREHVARVFMRRCGVSPAAWLRRQRLRQAELLLRSGAHRVADVAARCGFTSASHFAHVFRRAVGVSPRRFQG